MGPQPALAPLRRWDPERIGPFALLGRLGAGAMGQVYLGRSTAGRLVAVKTIKIEFAEEAGFRSRFAHEVAAARRVSGVFTAAVVAADADADVPWLATAYIAAPSLNRLVRSGGPLPVPAVRWLAAGCAEALESIHNAGLVHRDLKPSNVLVSPDGPRVIDFGVARAAERVQLTVTRGALGTPAYMAPEQARDTRQASTASDMFSLGATLLFAATGHPPYLGDTVMDILVRLATETPYRTRPARRAAPRRHGLPGAQPPEPPDLNGPPGRAGPLRRRHSQPRIRAFRPAESALTLIGKYERSPGTPEPGPGHDHDQPPLSDDVSEDATFGSYSALPVGASGAPRPRRPPKRVIAAVGLGIGAAALLAGGAVLGASLTDANGRSPGYSGRRPPLLPPPRRTPHFPPRRQRTWVNPGHAAQRDEHEAEARDGPALRRRLHGVRRARQRLHPADPGAGAPDRARGGVVPADRGRERDLQLRDRPGPYVLSRGDPGRHVPRPGHRGQGPTGDHDLPGPPAGATSGGQPATGGQQPSGRLSPPQVFLAGAPGRIVQPAEVGRGDDPVLDQHPDDHLVGEPGVRADQAAVGDLAPQHLDVL